MSFLGAEAFNFKNWSKKDKYKKTCVSISDTSIFHQESTQSVIQMTTNYPTKHISPVFGKMSLNKLL